MVKKKTKTGAKAAVKTKTAKTVKKKAAVKKIAEKKPAKKKTTLKKSALKKTVSKKPAAKKKLVKSPFNKKELEGIKKKLLLEMERIIQDVSGLKGDSVNKSLKDMSGDLSGYSFHMADMATDLYDREFALGLAEGERERLYELDEALKKIKEGTYGICETCGEKIPTGRLKVMPHAKYCIKHQEEMERVSGR